MTRLIVLLTDFGTTDTYVGVMKGVMLGIAPQLQFIDLTHAIQPQNVREAAFALLNSYRYFPADTIFLVIVDPGVGSSRQPIAVQAGEYMFVAPDNGVLSYVLHDFEVMQAVALDKPYYARSGISSTFHGRDIFAPAAAHLSAGAALQSLGSPLEQLVMLPEPTLSVEGKRITGEVLHVDHFGTVVTSIGLLRWVAPGRLTLNARFGEALALPIPAENAIISIGGQQIESIHRTYAEVARGDTLALVGSNGYLELAVNQGSFVSRLEVQIGDSVEIQIG